MDDKSRVAATLPEFIEECRRAMRARRLSLHTERTYLAVIEQFIRFHHQRPGLAVRSPLDL